MKRYRVYFEQENQDIIEVNAQSEDVAIKKAKKEWLRDKPNIFSIEEVEEDE